MYSVALAGSTIYALMTVASAYALGWITQHTILPAFAKGDTTTAGLVGAAALIIGVSIVKCVGIGMRRTGAAIMQYRLMGAYRRRITKQYLHLPLSWHQDWSTGTLLSNANSDVEAMWSNIAPFPLACGVIIMLLATAGLLVATDWVLALVGFVVFPAGRRDDLRLRAGGGAARDACAGVARRGQQRGPRQLRRCAGGQDAGSRGR